MANFNQSTRRRVMIGTPSYDGKVEVSYTSSLFYTTKAAEKRNIELLPLWVSFDALIQRARNDTLQLAYESGVDDLVWIDQDIEWTPQQFFKLLDHPVDVVGGTYPKKGDRPEYVVRQMTKRPIDPQTGLMEVDGLGTGFARMSRQAIHHLWNTSQAYIDPKDMKQRRMICDVIVTNNGLMSEDIRMFEKLQEGGFPIYLDTTITCKHGGYKQYQGDFLQWYTGLGQTKGRQL